MSKEIPEYLILNPTNAYWKKAIVNVYYSSHKQRVNDMSIKWYCKPKDGTKFEDYYLKHLIESNFQ